MAWLGCGGGFQATVMKLRFCDKSDVFDTKFWNSASGG